MAGFKSLPADPSSFSWLPKKFLLLESLEVFFEEHIAIYQRIAVFVISNFPNNKYVISIHTL
jgi:hypothetical protein